MKLYYAPGACSLSPHIVLRETGARFALAQVDLRARRTAEGADFSEINPKGYVPALELDDGQVLTEGAAIVQYLADLHPDSGLAPEPGGLARARLQEQLNFIASELHKAFTPLFGNPDDAARQAAIAKIGRRLGDVEAVLADGRRHLLGDPFTVADAYLFTVVNWTGSVGIDIAPWPQLAAFMARVGARPKVVEAMRAEGLI